MLVNSGDIKMNYNFRCNSCQSIFDIAISLEEYLKKPIIICPECLSSDNKRIFMNVPAIVYRGQGFTKKVEEPK